MKKILDIKAKALISGKTRSRWTEGALWDTCQGLNPFIESDTYRGIVACTAAPTDMTSTTVVDIPVAHAVDQRASMNTLYVLGASGHLYSITPSNVVSDLRAGTSGQGNAGGSTVGGNGSTSVGSGGGGASAAGQSAATGGAGGAGVANSISGSSVTYGGGGGGGGWSGTGGAGGAGGGGAGSNNNSSACTAGTNGLGGGGGGKANGGGCGGGSGVVIVRYLTADFPASTGGSISTDGSYTIHTFTSSDTLVLSSSSFTPKATMIM